MMGMKVGDYVKHASRGHIGCVTETGNGSVYVTNAATGKRSFWTALSLVPSTQEAYDAQAEQRNNPESTTVRPTETKPYYRWLCFECGNNYNGRECPFCGGTDRIENVDNPYPVQPARTEAYSLEEGV